MNFWILLRRELHVSWILSITCMGMVAGVIGAQYVSSLSSIVWLFTGMGLLGYCLWQRCVYVAVIAVVAGGLLGLWRGGVMHQAIQPYERMAGREVQVRGIVSDDVDVGKKGETVLRLNVSQVNDVSIQGMVWVATNSQPGDDMRRSDVVTVKGKLAPGFGSFAASMYNATILKAERPQPGDMALSLRDYFADKIRMNIHEPEASLGIGYLVGQRRALPEDLDRALQIAGLTQIVVASGYNLTILVRLARRFFAKISKFMAAFAAGGMIVSFVAVSGLSPSMSRAGLVAGFSLLAWYYGRSFHPLVLLPLAAAATLLINPTLGWGDLGWQLSFAAFAGVMIVAPLMQRYFFGKDKPGTIRQILGETIAAQLCTLPILLVAFGQLSNVALLANVLVLPLVPLAMLLTFFAGIGAILLPGLTLVGWPASMLLEYMTAIAQYMARLPWAQSEITLTSWTAVGCYLVIGAACLYAWRKTAFNLREANLVE